MTIVNLLAQQLVNGLVLGSFYALVALGYTMVFGVVKLLNFAHGDLYMVGAFVGFLVAIGVASQIPQFREMFDGYDCGVRYAAEHIGRLFNKLADMGEHWEATTGLPIPLGAIIAKRSLGKERLHALADAVRRSVRRAWDDPEASRAYVLAHAQEMDPAVADQHIGLYVNEFTADLGEDGYAAIRGLLERAAAEGLLPPLGPDALAFP